MPHALSSTNMQSAHTTFSTHLSLQSLHPSRRYDLLKLGAPQGTLKSKEVLIAKTDKLSKAPPETTLKKGDRVRVAQNADYLQGGRQKWQYGIVYYVHSKLIVHVKYEGGVEESKGLPAYEHEIQQVAVA